MKKVSIFLLLWLLCCIDLHAAPKLQVEDEFKIGLIDNLNSFNLKIAVKNEGDSDLIVKALNSSCDCIKIIFPRRKITLNPQEQLDLEVRINPQGYLGEVKKSVYLFTSDPQEPLKRLTINFVVNEDKPNTVKRFLSFNFLLILTAGLIDGINPCAFSVMVFFISFLIFRSYQRRQIILAGSSFLFGVFSAYLLLGLGLLKFLKEIEFLELISNLLYFSIAGLAIVLGLISIWDYFRYKRSKDFSSLILKLPQAVKNGIHNLIREDFKGAGLSSIFSLIMAGLGSGIAVAVLESVCTGQMYLPTISYIFNHTQYKGKAFLWLLLYNFCFIIPLVVIFILALAGVSSEDFSRFMRRRLLFIKLVSAAVFLILGIVLILLKVYAS